MKPPFIPDDAPFTGDQKSWLAGFLAGLQSAKQMADQKNASLAVTAGQVAPRLDILYGSQTGNAEGVAITSATVAFSLLLFFFFSFAFLVKERFVRKNRAYKSTPHSHALLCNCQNSLDHHASAIVQMAIR